METISSILGTIFQNENIVWFINVLFLGFMSACLGMTFQFFLRPNMIFYPWSYLITKLAYKNEVLRHLMRPFGRCRYCNTTWIAMFVYMFYYGFQIQMALMIGVTFFFLRILDVYVFPGIDPNKETEDVMELEPIPNPTPVPPMLKAYVIIAAMEIFMYVGVPYIAGIFIHGQQLAKM